MARYYEETLCEHGRMIDCDEPRIVSRDDDGGYVTEFCPGGSRRELEDVEIVESDSFAGITGPDWEFHTDKPGIYAIIPLSREDVSSG